MIRRSVIVYKISTDILLNDESLAHLMNVYQLEILDVQKTHTIIALTETHEIIEKVTALLTPYGVIEYSKSSEAIISTH